jgi:hypothetical protein
MVFQAEPLESWIETGTAVAQRPELLVVAVMGRALLCLLEFARGGEIGAR